MASHKNTAVIVTYSDHEVIKPENKLRKYVSEKPPGTDDDDPVARAEAALAAISNEFGTMMDDECARLDQARRTVADIGFTPANTEALFNAAHDIKGQAATFGYPAVAAAADSLCRLIEYTPETNRIPGMLVDRHVDAVRAIYREYARSDAKELARLLTQRLRDVTDDFLTRENRHNPDVIEQIRGASIIPD